MQQTPEHKKHRTVGNKIFDLLVYPSIAFGAVFAFSIWALHSTKFGAGRAHDFFESTNAYLANKLEVLPFFKNMGAEKRAGEARNYASILISFATGTLLISPITFLEHRRHQISQCFDRLLGIEPKDPSFYAPEPRQSWKSIYGGRAITFATVLGLGTAVGEKRTNQITDKAVSFVEKNWKRFNPSASEATLAKVRQWTEVSAFEAFYSALCAGLVYGISRGLARILNKEEDAYANVARAQPIPQASQGEEEQEATNSARSSWRQIVGEDKAKNGDYSQSILQSRVNRSPSLA